MTVTHLIGPALEQLATIPTGSVDLLLGSPPFLALRNYNDVAGQWGSEPDPASFIDNLLTLATETRRVLAPHGSMVVELGDTFAGSGGAGGDYNPGGLREGQQAFSGSATAERLTRKYGRVQADGLPPIINRNGKVQGGGPGWPGAKSLCGTPTLFAWSLAYGRNLLRPDHTVAPWLIRNVIVWARNNPPVGALGDKFRPATSYITVATPSARRWFDLDAVRTPGPSMGRDGQKAGSPTKTGVNGYSGFAADAPTIVNHPAGAPPLDHWHDEPDGDLLWLINTQGSSLAHYAMWPPRLVERLILAMCPAEVCQVCGEPRRRIIEASYSHPSWASGGRRNGLNRQPDRVDQLYAGTTIGWSDCGCGPGCVPASWEERDIPASYRADGKLIATARRERVMVDPGHCDGSHYRPGHVCDPGTTLAVADILGRDATGIDIDPANPGLYPTRYAQCWAALRPDAGPSPVTSDGRRQGVLEL